MKKVLVIAASPRRKGAEEAGNNVEVVYLREYKINYCSGCLSCLKTGSCFQQDDANGLVRKFGEADAICFASPVYYYSVCGQMKVFLDRLNALYGKMRDKDFYYMMTAESSSHRQMDRAFDVFDGFADCFANIRRCGRVYGGGAADKGGVKNLPAYNEAYEMGKKV